MFAYCNNNPVNRIDIYGTDSSELNGCEDLLDDPLLEGGGGGNGKPSGGGGGGSGFRAKLQVYTGKSGVGYQAHHVFPQKFKEYFDSLGINIHNPQYGAWWETSAHQHYSNAYNQWWDEFFKTEGVTKDTAMALADFLATLFGYDFGS